MRRGARRRRTDVEAHTASAPALPPLDEATFQQLLEAAYVLQERREAKLVPHRSLDAAEVLALIAQTQEQLRSQVRDLPTAAQLIAERLEQVTNAAGVAIAVIRGDQLEFCTATGILASLAGSSAPVGSNLPELLRANSWSSIERAIHYDAKCPIAFPIFHEGKTTGLLHLSFPEKEKLEEHQIRTCQVMAGLMGEAISRVSELEWKQTLTAERTTMMEILERLRPQLERLAAESTPEPGVQAAADAASEADFTALFRAKSGALETEQESATQLSGAIKPETKPAISTTHSCQQCGAPMSEAEVFCDKCGAPQLTEEIFSELSPQRPQNVEAARPPSPANPEPEEDVSLPPSLEQALAHLPTRDVVERFRPRIPIPDDAPGLAPEPVVPEIPRDAALRDGSITLGIPGHVSETPIVREPAEPELPRPAAAVEAPTQPRMQLLGEVTEEEASSQIATPTHQTQKPSPWVSAARAYEWLESLQRSSSPGRAWVTRHRADLWVVVSVILLLLVLSGWGSRSAIYGAAQSKVVQPSLTLFERFLVALDLAQPPPAPVYVGNPNVRVWVDLHTALYYCPGAELYGKTPEGKFTTQRDAQLDQFEPAARTYCQ